jgi:CheY-like chemotaxis protein
MPDQAQGIEPGGSEPGGSALRALVIDDNATNRALAAAVLDAHDIGVDQAADGAEGISKLRCSRYDLVFLDVSMPGMDGFEVCRRIRGDSGLSAPYVVAYTAHAFPTQKAAILEAGFDALLVKPITLRDVTRIIEPLRGPR